MGPLVKAALLFLPLWLAAACGGSTCGNCRANYNYCRDPGGGGADLCCPTASPYYCAADNGCHADPFFSCPSGKVFCSSQNNC